MIERSLPAGFAGVSVQLRVFMAMMGLSEMGIVPARLWLVLLPGIELFWAQGIHGDLPFYGLPLAIAFNTFIYAVIAFGILWC